MLYNALIVHQVQSDGTPILSRVLRRHMHQLNPVKSPLRWELGTFL